MVIFGAGGLGREVLNVFRASAAAGRDVVCHGFIVDPEFATVPTLHDMPMYGDLSILRRDQDIRVVVAVGDPSHRRAIAENIEGMVGPRFASAIHPGATIGGEVRIDTGIMVLGPASIAIDVSIGRHVVINPLVTVSHDCRLADYATLAPGVAIAGGVEVAEGAELGTGANVIPRLTVGAWSVVGAGATVIRSVAANSTVAGVPARQIGLRSPGWHDRQ